MGFNLDISVPVLTVFFQGLFSFFSPCVLPLIPLYIGYLSGGTGRRGEDGKIYYDHKKVMLHTLFFVIGVSFAFFVLGLGVSALGTFFKSNQTMFARIGGIIVILFGLYQLGIFGTSAVLGKERRLPFQLNVLAMSPAAALIMGFTFSFAWTPCVGPALASVLLMAASASTKMMAFVLIGVYTLGFVLPFLAVGLFTTTLLDFFKKNGHIVQYAVKAGAVLMIIMGLLMFTGKMNAVTGYLSEISVSDGGVGKNTAGKQEESGKSIADAEKNSGSVENGDGQGESMAQDPKENGQGESAAQDPAGTGQGAQDDRTSSQSQTENGASGENESASGETGDGEKDPNVLPAIDFTLTDQYGNSHTLSDYKGKTVFLNFWATWCPPCRREMPDIQKLYDEYREADDDSVVILGVAAPDFGQEQSEDGIKQFLEDNGYTYPVVMDTSGDIFMSYGVFSYPTTFMIDKNGDVFGYASGQLSEDVMRSIIQQTVEGKRK